MATPRNNRFIATLATVLAAAPLHAEETLSHGRFSSVTLYRPAGPVTSVVLFLSGDGGWNLGVVDMAEALKDQGALVAGIDVSCTQPYDPTVRFDWHKLPKVD